jgi:hypothetical protein
MQIIVLLHQEEVLILMCKLAEDLLIQSEEIQQIVEITVLLITKELHLQIITIIVTLRKEEVQQVLHLQEHLAEVHLVEVLLQHQEEKEVTKKYIK